MMRGLLNSILRNKPIAASAGFLIGRRAMGGSLWAQLLALASLGMYSSERNAAKIERAKEAARQAAIATAQRECGADVDCLKSPQTLADAREAAIEAGREVMDGES